MLDVSLTSERGTVSRSIWKAENIVEPLRHCVISITVPIIPPQRRFNRALSLNVEC